MVSYFMYFTLCYCVFSWCVVNPPPEFVSAGLTVQCIFSRYLGNENTDFVMYHIKSTAVTLLFHSLLPLGYFVGLKCIVDINIISLLNSKNILWLLFFVVSIILPILALLRILKWSRNQWANHPLAQDIHKLYNSTNNQDDQQYSWQHVATRINLEYRSVDKVTIHSNALNRIIIIDNWIMKVTPYKVYVAHQNNCVLIVHKTDTHRMSLATRDEVQYINIKVKGTNVGGTSFDIRLNSLDFQDLQNKVRRPIVILENVVIHRSLLDRFIDTFKECVSQNPLYDTTQELNQCIGCMQVEANVKLNKQCDGNPVIVDGRPVECVKCNCRPLWCIDCMARWFASRQDKNLPETWLSSKCPCPVCRATFCILDVCQVRKVQMEEPQ